MFKRLMLALLVCALTTMSLAKAEDFNVEAETATAALNDWYNGSNGLYNTTGWWNSANAVEATIDFMRYSGSKTYLPILGRTYNVNHNGNFFNNFYDDEGWWANAWVKAYDLTGNVAYLDQAKTIFNDMAAAWDSTCGGGIWWSKDRQYKASIANELFFVLAARLHNRTPGDANYLNWANKEWNWFKNSGLLKSNNTVQDGIHKNGCTFSNYVASYNQGVVLGGLVELNKATGDASLLTTAENIANATVNSSTYSPNGILKAPCNNGCTGDLPQFDGIFMRYLKLLYDKTRNPAYQTYMMNNAHSIWANDRNGSNHFGVNWAGPYDQADAARQSSALDALNTQVTNASALQNIAFGKSSSSNGAACATAEASNNALDGGLNSNWCQSGGGGQSLTIDLGSNHTITQFVLYHANAGGQAANLNTRDFNIQTGTDNSHWSTRTTVTGNTSSITTHNIPSVTARYVRLNIVTAQSTNTNQSARIYEFQVMGPVVATAAPIKYEAESLAVAGFSSRDVKRVATDTGYSNGEGVILEGNAVGDFMIFTANIPNAATYSVQVGYKSGTNRGTWQLSTDGTNHGSTVDGYSANSTFPIANLGNVSLSAGNHAFKFDVTGKNAHSSAYWMAIDYILLTPQ